MKHYCPLCKTETTKEIKEYVLKEIEKVGKDPNYIPKVYGEKK